MKTMSKEILILSLLALIAAGCSSNIPQPIREKATGDLQLAEARGNIEHFVGNRVRWGGTIAAVENRAEETWIEVVGRKLDSEGEPTVSDNSEGRFIAVLSGFYDPVIFAEGRSLTVAGTLEGETSRPIGSHAYRYPIVRVETHYLWAEKKEPDYYYRDPFLYDPFFYDPWYPWRRPYWPYYY